MIFVLRINISSKYEKSTEKLFESRCLYFFKERMGVFFGKYKISAYLLIVVNCSIV